MLNEKIAKLLNTQINKEFYSAYLYLHFANFYVEQGLNGFANWYQIQAQEERDHALLMLQYLQNNDAKVALEAIAQPDAVLKENMDPLKAGLAHEQYVTGLIHTIYEAAYASPACPNPAPQPSNRAIMVITHRPLCTDSSLLTRSRISTCASAPWPLSSTTWENPISSSICVCRRMIASNKSGGQ